jgi:RNA polymerase sigma-70 factor (ECF subfamily)
VPQDSQQDEFAALLDDFGPSILALLRRLCGNRHDADDLFQDTAVRVWKRLNDRPSLRNRRAWLTTIAYHVFLDHRGRRRVTETDGKHVEGQEPRPDVQAEVTEDACRVNSAIAALSGDIREVILLHYNGGLTLRETADAMGINEGTVKSRLNTALKELRRRLG